MAVSNINGNGSTEIQRFDFERDDVEESGRGGIDGDASKIEHWTKQITIRGLFASLVIGTMYSVIVMKLNLTTGLVPNLNVSAALLAFVFVRSWTKLLHRAGITSKPFTRQENTVIQTCAVACYSIAVGGNFVIIERKTQPFSFFFSRVCFDLIWGFFNLNFVGGFGSYLLGLNTKTYLQAGIDTPGNTAGSTKEPGIAWMTGFLFVSCFVGLLALVPLRKVFI